MPDIMWQRFTMSARTVVQEAQRIASESGTTTVTQLHFLKALLQTRLYVVNSIMSCIGVDCSDLERHLDSLTQPAKLDPIQTPAQYLAPSAGRLLNRTMRESAGLGNSYIGTEHLLLAFLSSRDPVIKQVLAPIGGRKPVFDYVQSLQFPLGPDPYNPQKEFARRCANIPGWGNVLNETMMEFLRIRDKTIGLANYEYLAEVAEFVQQSPTNAFVHMQAAELYSSRGFKQECLIEAKLAMEIEPTHPLLYRRLAYAALLNNDPELAQQALNQGWKVYEPLVQADQMAFDREFWFGETA